MICIDVSDVSISIVEYYKNVLGKLVIKSLKQIKIAEDEDWVVKVLPLIKNKKVSFVIPDTKVFIHRIKKDKNISKEEEKSFVFEKVAELIPVSKNEQLYDYKSVNGEILFVGIAFQNFLPYYQAIKKAKAEFVFVIPESIAYFEFFRGKIKKEEVVAYLDIGDKKANLSFLDAFGPISTFTQSVELSELEQGVKKAIVYFEKNCSKKISVLILGGSKNTSFSEENFKEIIDGDVFKADVILQKKIKEIGLKIKSSESLAPFFNVLGLVLASDKKENINLTKKETLENLNKFFLNEKNQRLKEVKQKKEDEEKTEDYKKPKQSKFAIFVLILLILAAPALAIYFTFFRQQSSTEIKKEEPVSIAEESVAVPTVEVLQKENLKIQILNGSGTEGEAAVAAQLLRDKGYLEDIATGNADSYDYLETVIQIKEDKVDFFEDLKNDLGIGYVVADNYESLDTDGEFDAIIVVGSERS